MVSRVLRQSREWKYWWLRITCWKKKASIKIQRKKVLKKIYLSQWLCLVNMFRWWFVEWTPFFCWYDSLASDFVIYLISWYDHLVGSLISYCQFYLHNFLILQVCFIYLVLFCWLLALDVIGCSASLPCFIFFAPLFSLLSAFFLPVSLPFSLLRAASASLQTVAALLSPSYPLFPFPLHPIPSTFIPHSAHSHLMLF